MTLRGGVGAATAPSLARTFLAKRHVIGPERNSHFHDVQAFTWAQPPMAVLLPHVKTASSYKHLPKRMTLPLPKDTVLRTRELCVPCPAPWKACDTPAAIGLLGPYGPQQPDDCASPWSLCSPKAAETPQACAVRMASQSAFSVQPLGKHVISQLPSSC